MAFKLMPVLAVCILGLGNILHIVGLATPEWVTKSVTVPFFGKQEVTQGLWEACANSDCKSIDDDVKTDWYKACEALAILGMLAGLGSLLFAGLIFLMGLMGKQPSRFLGIISLLGSVLSFLLIIICVILFAVKVEESKIEWDLGYSFGLCIAGAVLIIIGGFFANSASRS